MARRRKSLGAAGVEAELAALAPALASKEDLPWAEPYLVRDPYSMVGTQWLVLGPVFMGVRCVGANGGYFPGVSVKVIDRVIQDWQLRNYPRAGEERSLQDIISGIKKSMLDHGASSLAVEWIGALSPFTQKELNTMAEKLKTKNVAAADSAPKAASAKTAKVAKAPKETSAKKGNPEALSKAREASAGKRAELDTKKITINTEKKANPYREGTKAHATFELIKTSKTVADVRTAATDAHDFGYVRYASRDGHITLS